MDAEYDIMSVDFELDENKAKINFAKHGVSFDEAKTIFDDPFYVDFYDPDHSEDEERYIIIGQSKHGRLLVLAYTERKHSTRLISARMATRKEKDAYEED